MKCYFSQFALILVDDLGAADRCIVCTVFNHSEPVSDRWWFN
jgi:hypothetical protein